MSGAGTLGSLLDSDSPLDERPLSQFQGSVSEWSDMRITCDEPCSERMIECKEGPRGPWIPDPVAQMLLSLVELSPPT
ncbi:hypothetical protein GQ600_10940 [Phytophthora cactorum]|nr:hypothetical protein GQ600_10940 [Phytophthora cactorum]